MLFEYSVCLLGLVILEGGASHGDVCEVLAVDCAALDRRAMLEGVIGESASRLSLEGHAAANDCPSVAVDVVPGRD